MDWTEIATILASTIITVGLPIMGAFLKRKWDVEIDVAQWQANLNAQLIEAKHKDTLHSAAASGAAVVVDRLGEAAVTDPGARAEIKQAIRDGAVDALVALSPGPDALERIAIRAITDQIGKLRKGTQ